MKILVYLFALITHVYNDSVLRGAARLLAALALFCWLGGGIVASAATLLTEIGLVRHLSS